MMVYLLPVGGYLLGSLSSAILLARVMGLRDPREVGSGNPGATNILRYGGKKAAVSTLLGDMLKGLLPVLLARSLSDEPWVLALTAFGAFLGHLYPLYFGFKGGKGVATAFGVFLGLHAGLGLALLLSWIVVALLFRYSSLAALLTAVLAPVYAWWLLPHPSYVGTSLVIALLLIWRHRGNIRRLASGAEDRIGAARAAATKTNGQ